MRRRRSVSGEMLLLLLLPFLLCSLQAAASESPAENSHGECGIRYELNRFEPTISNGQQTKFNEFPWHVAIFRLTEDSFEYICGGTIIDPIMVITAAHCVYDEAVNEIDNSDLVVAVGKYHSSWDIVDRYEKRYKVIKKKIKKTYVGTPNRYADDIALLALNDTIRFNSLVMPICIDWKGHLVENFQNQVGLIAGWGYTEEGRLSDELRSAKLRYLSFTECRKRIEESYKYYVTSDKFCTENVDSNGVAQGDAGGALIFPTKTGNNGPQYFMEGILSGSDRNNSIATFTDINLHMAWLISTMRNIRAEIIATEGCGKRHSVTYMDKDGGKALHTDYPWLATIYLDKEKDFFGVRCSGTIIHPRAVITSASCLEDMSTMTSSKPVKYKVVVGKHNLTMESIEPYEQRLNVVKIHKHENYKVSGDRSENDIAIIVVDDDIKFSKAVVPICIDTDDKLKLYKDPQNLGKIVSWNDIECNCQRESAYKYISHENCRNEFETAEEYQKFITDKVFCGQFVNGFNSLNSSLTGAGLVYQSNTTTDQRNYLYGVVTKGSPPKGNTILLTKIETSLRWISDILDMIYNPRHTWSVL